MFRCAVGVRKGRDRIRQTPRGNAFLNKLSASIWYGEKRDANIESGEGSVAVSMCDRVGSVDRIEGKCFL